MIENYEREHQLILDRAMELFTEKSSVRGQMWLEWPPSDKIREMRERVMRIESAYANRERLIPFMPEEGIPHSELDKVIIEDSIDLINYTVFLVKQIQRGRSG